MWTGAGPTKNISWRFLFPGSQQEKNSRGRALPVNKSSLSLFSRQKRWGIVPFNPIEIYTRYLLTRFVCLFTFQAPLSIWGPLSACNALARRLYFWFVSYIIVIVDNRTFKIENRIENDGISSYVVSAF